MLLRLDAETLECEATGFVVPEGDSLGGLAFVSDSPGSEEESLYVSSFAELSFDEALTVSRYDPIAETVEVVGDLPIIPTNYYQIADLTGTGASDLFGLFAGDTAHVATIDEADATATSQPLGATVGSPWAFAQWEGRLWIFSGGTVRAFDQNTGDIEVLSESLEISVVGAAVSTCAPYVPAG